MIEPLCQSPSQYHRISRLDFAKLLDKPPNFVRRKTRKGVRGRGIKYEEDGHKYFEKVYKHEYISGPWIQYFDRGSNGYCQPDALLFDREKLSIIILEFKLKHTSDSWFQLMELYLPCISYIFPAWDIKTVTIVKWFDPSVLAPEQPRMLEDIKKVNINEYGLHIWKRRAGKK